WARTIASPNNSRSCNKRDAALRVAFRAQSLAARSLIAPTDSLRAIAERRQMQNSVPGLFFLLARHDLFQFPGGHAVAICQQPGLPARHRLGAGRRQPASEIADDVDVLGIARQVGPLVGIGCQVIELLRAVGVANETPLLGPDRMVTGIVRRDGWPRPGSRR